MEDLPAFTLLQDALHLVSRRATPVANSARGAANHPSSLTHPLRGDLLRPGQMPSASLLPMQMQVQVPEAVHETQAGRPYPSLPLASMLVSMNTDPQVQIGMQSGQQQPWPQSSQRRIRITLWRFLNTAFILSFGISKAVYAYQGLSTIPNTLDWILGVFWTLISYWFGLLESECRDIWPWFFQRELDLQLPLYVANVIIAMFATFFTISICFTTVTLLVKWIILSKYQTLIIALSLIMAPCLTYGILCTRRLWVKLVRKFEFLRVLSQPWHALKNLFSSEDEDKDTVRKSFADQGFLFLWLLPFVAFVVFFNGVSTVQAKYEPSELLGDFRSCIMTSVIFGVAAVSASGVTFGVVGIFGVVRAFRMGMRGQLPA